MELLTTQQAALKLQVSPDTLRRLAREGKIRPINVDGHNRFDLDHLVESLYAARQN